MSPYSIPKTSLGARAAIKSSTILAAFMPAPFHAGDFCYALFLAAAWSQFYMLCAPDLLSKYVETCLITYSILLLLGYPWRSLAASLAAGSFPISLGSVCTEAASVPTLTITIISAGLASVALCALSLHAEGPRRELYALAHKRYAWVKARETKNLFLMLAMATFEALIIIHTIAPDFAAFLSNMLNNNASTATMPIAYLSA